MIIESRNLRLDIYMEESGDAEVVLFDNESSDSTSMTYNEKNLKDGSFKEWLVDSVTGWIMFMKEETEND